MVCASLSSLAAADPAKTAIVHARLLTISHGVIADGTLVMSDGKITAVGGPQTLVPSGARIYDASGLTVYPGLIDAMDNEGLLNGPLGGSQARHHHHALGTPVPDISVAKAVSPTETVFVDRLNGILNANVSPGDNGPEPGQAAFIQLADAQSDMVLVPNLALVLNFGKGSQRKDAFPSTAFGVAGFFRQQLTQLRDYRMGIGPHGKDGKQIPEPRLEALIPFVDGKRPIIALACSNAEVGVALDIAQEFGLKIILAGATGADTEVERIAAAKIPVIFGSIWDVPKEGERFDTTFSIPARLAQRGVKLAIATFGEPGGGIRTLPYAAGYAVAYGLPYDEALKSITLNAAQILGVADTLGSLDVGKNANVVIANGDPLDVSTDVKQIFLKGFPVDMKSPQTELRDKYTKGPKS
ncbi:MAG: hypothetical protein QOD56_602 [Gammaproteobacteria bacterium]|jgi:hypothetical protein|nr:hypothetical protein [Gammaproteobacteria bacterium]